MPDVEGIKKEEPDDEVIEVSEIDYLLDSNAMFQSIWKFLLLYQRSKSAQHSYPISNTDFKFSLLI